MNIWHLPGPSEYLDAVERSLRDGESVILSFPEGAPAGFETALHVRMADCGRWGRVEVSPADMLKPGVPLRQLLEQFAPELTEVSGVTAVELCEAEGFWGRLIWIEGLRSINCPAWMTFLGKYAHASRSVPRLRRTLFIAPVGADTTGDSFGDVALMVHEWAGVVDEMDLTFLANDRLRTRGIRGTLRMLLVMTIARVAAWDFNTAERLANASAEDILDPSNLLRSEASARGWVCETPRSVSRGTVSARGVVHAALASISEPDEIQRRIWSAQVSVLLPVIEVQRQALVKEYQHQIAEELRRDGRAEDPEELEIRDLAFLFRRVGFDRDVGYRVEDLRLARNALAHGQPLLTPQALALARVASDPSEGRP